jgi:hypothetical protein
MRSHHVSTSSYVSSFVFRSHLTGAIAALRTYFADYKLGATGRRNQFAFGGAAVSRARAIEAVREAHRQWSASFRGGAKHASGAAAAAAPV